MSTIMLAFFCRRDGLSECYVKTGDDGVYLSQDILEVCRFYPVEFCELIALFAK